MPLLIGEPLFDVIARVLERRGAFQRSIDRGYAEALRPPLREGPRIDARIPPGMLDALVAADLSGRNLEAHYCRAMPALLATQLRGTRAAEARLFDAPLSLARMPRLAEALEALFTRVADAGVPCAPTLGAATPAALIAARPTLGAFYAGCHFGRSMPMLYAYPGDLDAAAWAGRSAEEFIEARYVGPLVHELSHLHPIDPSLVPAPGNVHEALAAWLGSAAWPAQIAASEDALPGGAFLASVGAWIARATGEAQAIRAQAGMLDLEPLLGCTAALRLYGFLPFLETGAPHLLSDPFRPDRWWKLIDLHRDPSLAADFSRRLVEPLLAGAVAAKAGWDAALDAISWSQLPSWRDPPADADRALALLAERALRVRNERAGLSYRSVERPGALELDVASCTLRGSAREPDALGAPPFHPYPPALCARWAAAGVPVVNAAAGTSLAAPP